MWQKCPVCNGAGSNNLPSINSKSTPCHVCKGRGIVSQLTGFPPFSGSFLKPKEEEKSPYQGGIYVQVTF